jgi:hypothetical protein
MYTAKARTQDESIWNKLAKQNTQTEDRNKYDGGRNDTARNVVIPTGKNHWIELEVEGNIILKLILKK